MNQNQAQAMLSCSVDGQNIIGSFTTTSTGTAGTNALYSYTDYGQQQANPTLQVAPTLWGYWQNYYYPQVIRESYPVYIQEKAMDKGKLAFELLKALMDKNLVKVDKVKDFIEAMDTILKTL